jgi:hypothetical protein
MICSTNLNGGLGDDSRLSLLSNHVEHLTENILSARVQRPSFEAGEWVQCKGSKPVVRPIEMQPHNIVVCDRTVQLAEVPRFTVGKRCHPGASLSDNGISRAVDADSYCPQILGNRDSDVLGFLLVRRQCMDLKNR